MTTTKVLSEATLKTYHSCFKRYDKECSDQKLDPYATKAFHHYTDLMLGKDKPASRVAMVLKRIIWVCENDKNKTIDVDAAMLKVNKVKESLKPKKEKKPEPVKVAKPVEVKKVTKAPVKKVTPTKAVAKKVTKKAPVKKVAKKVTKKAPVKKA